MVILKFFKKIFSINFLLFISAFFYIVSIFLPGIVYKPSLYSNKKTANCSYAVKANVVCTFFSFDFRENGYECFDKPASEIFSSRPLTVIDAKPSPNQFVNKQKILDFCKGYDQPVVAIDYGFNVLFLGWLGIIMGIFAWLANPIIWIVFLLLFLSVKFSKILSIPAFFLSLGAFFLGLDAFNFISKPLDESGHNDLYVDHLGVGYYIWEFSIALLVIQSLVIFTFLIKESLKFEKEKAKNLEGK